ncbi:MAG: universal stress protein [bacterium]|nr:universal stress protein [bacterium]
MSYSRIVLAVALQRYIDFTPIALRAREIAMGLAQSAGARLEVVSVEAPVALLPEVETLEEKLNRFMAPLGDAGVDAAPQLFRGKPDEQILHFVESIGADLLIIGSHSKRGPIDVSMGGTAASLVDASPCPVLMAWATEADRKAAAALAIPEYPFIFPYG